MRILAYHEISKQPADAVHGVSPQVFRKQMEWLVDQGYRTRNLAEWACRSEDLGIMFDDGYEDTYSEAWPVLQALNLTATVFLVAECIGGTPCWPAGDNRAPLLNWEQVDEMARHGIQFGSHSATHPRLTDLSRESLMAQLKRSRRLMEDALGRRVELLSLPFSLVSAEVMECAQQAGFRLVFRFCPFYPGVGQDAHGAVRATGIVARDDLDVFKQKVLGTSCLWARWRLRQLGAWVRGGPLPDC